MNDMQSFNDQYNVTNLVRTRIQSRLSIMEHLSRKLNRVCFKTKPKDIGQFILFL